MTFDFKTYQQQALTTAMPSALNGTPAVPSKLTIPPALPKLTAAAEAVLDAWRIPGPCPEMHKAAKREVRKVFPYLAERLDEACDTRG